MKIESMTKISIKIKGNIKKNNSVLSSFVAANIKATKIQSTQNKIVIKIYLFLNIFYPLLKKNLNTPANIQLEG